MTKQLSMSGNNLLTDLIMEIKSGNLRRCDSLGLSPDEIRMLNNLTLEDLYYLSKSQVSVITYHIHHENLYLILEQSRLEQKRNECIDRALALGASIEMMHHYFGLSPVDVSTRRRLANLRVSVGRSSNLSEQDREALWSRWKKSDIQNINSAEGFEMMMLLAEELALSLTAVWNNLQDLLEVSPVNTKKRSLKRKIRNLV
ncbi:DUF2857 domain-containing protein [Xenorhabdus griffiniae]|uniref:DUF2857 domain-containing protein n=1 Tax=Xenorhabdus griffiniae TaxID=351672 RepID=A0ABY9XEW3_9GAMM|nr:DUF2857 domain-containing protein [Xenorhabdus griffiniae]MBD1225966.1 DUF2857 domain-containing protein [Xenorhabdus griffiniae]MBE8585916.1 DUF2857 domain-containing protein [Xenorhabdus griffiniae]WMV71456.1 DUF2857 domain-containing protein [Xenorhabdus griffiniae]WNH01133.1 DUF2857 domain-containing protein [Xenorhabdus griffiniae]